MRYAVETHYNELRAMCLTTNALCPTAEIGALLLKCMLIVYIWPEKGVKVYTKLGGKRLYDRKKEFALLFSIHWCLFMYVAVCCYSCSLFLPFAVWCCRLLLLYCLLSIVCCLLPQVGVCRLAACAVAGCCHLLYSAAV